MNGDERRHRQSYKAAVRLLDGQRRLTEEAGANSELLDALSAIIRHLNKLPPSQIDKIFSVQKAADPERKWQAELRAVDLSLDEIEHIVEDNDVTRRELEAIAIARFHVPRGSMRSLGNIDRLRDKLRTFVQNEKTHTTITEVAKSYGESS